MPIDFTIDPIKAGEFSKESIKQYLDNWFVEFLKENSAIKKENIFDNYLLNKDMHVKFLDAFYRSIQGDPTLTAEKTNISVGDYAKNYFAEKTAQIFGFYFPQGIATDYNYCIKNDELDVNGKVHDGRTKKLADDICAAFQTPELQAVIAKYKDDNGPDTSEWSFEARAKLCKQVYEQFLDPKILGPMFDELPVEGVNTRTTSPFIIFTTAIVKANFMVQTGLPLSRGFILGEKHAEVINSLYQTHPGFVDQQLEEIVNFYNRMEKVQIPQSQKKYESKEITFGMKCDLSGFTRDFIKSQTEQLVDQFLGPIKQEIQKTLGPKDSDKAPTFLAHEAIGRFVKGKYTDKSDGLEKPYTRVMLQENLTALYKDIPGANIEDIIQGIEKSIQSGKDFADILVGTIAISENERLTGYYIDPKALQSFQEATRAAKKLVGREKDTNTPINYETLPVETKIGINKQFSDALKKFEESFDADTTLTTEKREELKTEARQFIKDQQKEYTGITIENPEVGQVALAMAKASLKPGKDENPVAVPSAHFQAIFDSLVALTPQQQQQFITKYNDDPNAINKMLPKTDDIANNPAKLYYLQNMVENPELFQKVFNDVKPKSKTGEDIVFPINDKFVQKFNKQFEVVRGQPKEATIQQLSAPGPNRPAVANPDAADVVELERLLDARSSVVAQVNPGVQGSSPAVPSASPADKSPSAVPSAVDLARDFAQISASLGAIDQSVPGSKAVDKKVEIPLPEKIFAMTHGTVGQKLGMQGRDFYKNPETFEGRTLLEEARREIMYNVLEEIATRINAPLIEYKLVEKEDTTGKYTVTEKKILMDEKSIQIIEKLVDTTIVQMAEEINGNVDKISKGKNYEDHLLSALKKTDSSNYSPALQSISEVAVLSSSANLASEPTAKERAFEKASAIVAAAADKSSSAVPLATKPEEPKKGIGARFMDRFKTFRTAVAERIGGITAKPPEPPAPPSLDISAPAVVTAPTVVVSRDNTQAPNTPVKDSAAAVTPPPTLVPPPPLKPARDNPAPVLTDKQREHRNAQKQLLKAASEGNASKVSSLLQTQKANLTKEDKGEALRIAAGKADNVTVAAILANAKKDISSRDKGEALRRAASESEKTPPKESVKKREVVKTLLKAGDIHADDREEANRHASPETRKVFDKSEQRDFERLGAKGSVLRNAIRDYGAKKTTDGYTLSTEIRSERQKSKDIPSLLQGANRHDKIEGLRIAAKHGKTDIVPMILEKIEIPKEERGLGEALRVAAKYGNNDIVDMLLDKAGKDISPRDKGEALRVAAKNGHADVVDKLLDKAGKDISSRDKGEARREAKDAKHEGIAGAIKEHMKEDYNKRHTPPSRPAPRPQNGKVNPDLLQALQRAEVESQGSPTGQGKRKQSPRPTAEKRYPPEIQQFMGEVSSRF